MTTSAPILPDRAASRRLLLASTALSAALLASGTARANPPALPGNATPQGGQVVGGQASIAQAPGSVTIHQSSARAAINWQSFNVGAGAKVTFDQPNAQAIALNRVISNNPSIIAGRIDANGQIVLMNQSGVVFTPGSQVNAESLVVSTAGISAKNFMAGKMLFDAPPKPGARIVNDGTITMKQAGLAAFVAPQVVNRGTITATLGHVILAGASTFTLDISGDGLVSIDVTQAVRKVDLGGRVVNALVTNQGVIIANGGTVTLTAQAVDGIIQTLLDVRGVVQADSVGRSRGAITIEGIGGDLQVAGSLLARGTQPGSGGGTIAVDASGAVKVASTALIDASGKAGGGVVALGTDATRAVAGPADTTAPKAKRVSIAAGAHVSADAEVSGSGGRITALSTTRTTQDGALSAQGIAQGGTIETSSDGVISLSGTETVFAAQGASGTILLDPATLVVTSKQKKPQAGITTVGGVTTIGTDSATTSYVDPGVLDGLNGTIILTASSLLSVASAISMADTSPVTLASGGAMVISSGVSVGGSLEIDAAGSLVIGGPFGANISAANITVQDYGTGNNVDIDGLINAGTLLGMFAGGSIAEANGGYVVAPTLTSAGGTVGGDVLLNDAAQLFLANTIGTITSFAAAGTLAVDNARSALALGSVNVGAATLSAGDITFAAPVSVTGELDLTAHAGLLDGTISQLSAGPITAGTLALSAANSALLDGAANTIASLGTVSTGGSFALDDGGSSLTIAGALSATGASIAAAGLTLAAPVSVGTTGFLGAGGPAPLTLTSTAGIDETGTGSVLAGTLSGNGGTAAGDNVLLTATNTIDTLAGFTTGGSFSLNDAGTLLDVTGGLGAGAATLTGDGIEINAPVSVSGVLALGSTAGITATGGGITAGILTSDGGTIGGDVVLPGTNDIGSLGAFADTGTFQLDNGTSALTLAGPFSATVATIAAGAIGITGLASVASSLVVTGSSLMESGTGAVDAGMVSTGDGSIGGTVALSGTNAIGTIGGLSATGGLLVDDTQALVVAGPVRAGGIDLIDAQGLTLAGSLTVGSGQAIGLVATTMVDDGAVLSASGGTIALAPFTPGTPLDFGGATAGDLAIAPSFASAIAGSGAQDVILGQVVLPGVPGVTYAADTVLTEGSLASFGGNLVVDGLATITNAADLQANALTLAGGSIVNDGTLDAAALALSGTGFNGTGPVIAATLAGSFSNGAVFDSGHDAIGLVSGLTAAGGNLLLVDGVTPTIGGSIVVTAGGDLTVAAPAISLGAGGSFVAPQGVVTFEALVAGTPIAVGGGAAGTFDVGSGLLGAIAPGAAALVIGNTLSGPLTVSQALSLGIGDIVLHGDGIAVDEPVSVANILDLESTGSISQQGLITATSLIGMAGANAVLEGSNRIGTLGAFTDTNGLLVLTVAGALTVDGPVTGPTILLNATHLTIPGVIDAGSLALNAPLGSVVGNGTITATSLTGTALGLTLGGPNDIGTLGALTVTDAALLNDDAPLTIAGPVAAATLGLGDTGSIGETGSITATTLVSLGKIGGNVVLDGVNTIATLGDFSAAGNVTLDDAAALAVTGTLGAATAALAATSLAIDGSIATGSLALTSNTDITESGGITATDLAAIAPGSLALLGLNTIGTLGAVSVTGDATIDDGIGLALGGPFSAANATFVAPGLAVNGSVATGLLSIATTGSLTGLGAITAGTLTGSAGALVALDGANTIATLSNFTGTGDFGLNDTSPLVIAGLLDVPGVASFGDDGNITEPGSIVAGTLASIRTIGGTASFTGSNTIGSIGDFAAQGGFDLADSGNFSIAGTLAAASVSLTTPGSIGETGVIDTTLFNGNALGLTLGGPNDIGTLGALTVTDAALLNNDAPLTIAGPVTVATLGLGDTGSIGETGSITATTLVSLGKIGGNVVLDGVNTIATLGDFSAGGNVTLDDAAALEVTGTLGAANAALAAASLAIGGSIATGSLALTSTTDITESGGITATDLAAIAPGSLALLGQNTIGTLGAVSVTGDATIDDGIGLALGGPFSAANATFVAPGLAVNGSVATGLLSIATTGSLTGLGAITAGTLTGSAGALVALDGANTIATLSNFTGTGDFGLNDTSPLVIAGLLDVPGVASFGDGGNITEPGSIVAGTLASIGTIGGTASFTGSNTIGAVGDFAAQGGFDLADSGNFGIAGTLAAASVSLTTPGSIGETGVIDTGLFNGTALGLTLGGPNDIGTLGALTVTDAALLNDDTPLTIAGPVTVATLGLGDTGSIGETGSITATTLVSLGKIGGNVVLDGVNTIATLGDFSAAGNVTLDDAAALAVTGSVTAPNASLAAAALTIPGTIAATTLGLISARSIDEGGSIDANMLDARAGGDVALTGINNIGTLGGFTVTGNATIADGATLSMAGPFSAANATVTAAGLAIPGPVSIAGTLLLGSTGPVTESGSIVAATLGSEGLIGGTVALGGTNTIVTLADFAAGGDVDFADTAPLTIAGTFKAPNAALAADGFAIPGDIAVPGLLSLSSLGAIHAPGTIMAGTLTGTSGGAVLLDGTDRIATLGDFHAGSGAFTLIDGVPLRVSGAVNAADIVLTAPTTSITGTLTTPGTLGLGGGTIIETGAISAAVLQSQGALGGYVSLAGSNRIGMLGQFDDAGHALSLVDGGPLDLAGPVTAQVVSISATGMLTLDGIAGGGLFINGQAPAGAVTSQTAPRPGIDSVLSVVAGGAQQLVQTGIFDIDAGPIAQQVGLATQPNMLFVDLNTTGSASFADLVAPNTTMVISLGGGAASGQLDLKFLAVAGSYAGKANFTGMLDNVSGQAAAHNSVVVPVPGVNYRFNACIIGSVNCTVLPVVTLPEASPLQDFDLTPTRRRRLDRDVRLPGIAAKDY